MKLFSIGAVPKGLTESEKNSKTLIFAFEVIVQPPKTLFLTFSKAQKTHYGEKSETKIMKITHSACSEVTKGDIYAYLKGITSMIVCIMGDTVCLKDYKLYRQSN